MKTYIIGLSLYSQTHQYDDLVAHITAMKSCAHVLEDIWAVQTSLTPEEVHSQLSHWVQDGDALFVVESAGSGAWRNVLCDNGWLQENL